MVTTVSIKLTNRARVVITKFKFYSSTARCEHNQLLKTEEKKSSLHNYERVCGTRSKDFFTYD